MLTIMEMEIVPNGRNLLEASFVKTVKINFYKIDHYENDKKKFPFHFH